MDPLKKDPEVSAEIPRPPKSLFRDPRYAYNEKGQVVSKTDEKGNVLCIACELPAVGPHPKKPNVRLTSPFVRVKHPKVDGYIHQACGLEVSGAVPQRGA